MKEVTVRYSDPKTLTLLKTLARFFNFSVSSAKAGKTDREAYDYINGVPVIPGDITINVKPLNKVFTEKNLNARILRTEGWQR